MVPTAEDCAHLGLQDRPGYLLVAPCTPIVKEMEFVRTNVELPCSLRALAHSVPRRRHASILQDAAGPLEIALPESPRRILATQLGDSPSYLATEMIGRVSAGRLMRLPSLRLYAVWVLIRSTL